MPDAWSLEEVAATVADYFAMFDLEIRGQSYNKAEHNRLLRKLLNDRSPQAIEFKHANISAVLNDEGLPYINGYKPRSNYQQILRDAVIERLRHDRELVATIAEYAEGPAPSVPTVRSLTDVIVDPPTRDLPNARVYEARPATRVPMLGVNYLEREARNSSLGAAGERFVLEVEHQRLWEAGNRDLAGKIDHVATTRGDGLGYDIASFELDGRERFIEVKTTSFGARTPFFASKGEVAVSEELSDRYRLYRVFKFRESPKVFILAGSLHLSCSLDPVQFRAALR